MAEKTAQETQNQELPYDPDKDHDEMMKNFSELSSENQPSEEKDTEKPTGEEKPTEEETPLEPDQKETSEQKPEEDLNYWKAEAEKRQQALDAEIHRTKSWEGRISAANKKLKEAEEKAAALAAELAERAKSAAKGNTPAEPTPDEEEATIQKFLEDFPELEKPLRALIRKEAGIKEKQKEEPVETPPEKPAETSSQETRSNEESPYTDEEMEAHWNTITTKHPDAKEIRDDVQKWINQQPSLLKKTLSGYFQQGTATEIIEMLDLFKADVEKQKNTLKETRDKKRQNLETVPHDTGGPIEKPEVDKNDFDAAFKEFAAEEEKKSQRR